VIDDLIHALNVLEDARFTVYDDKKEIIVTYVRTCGL